MKCRTESKVAQNRPNSLKLIVPMRVFRRHKPPNVRRLFAEVASRILFTIGCFLPFIGSGAEFGISFLEKSQILAETCSVLKSIGVSDESTRTFIRLVEWQNQGGNGVDISRFPVQTNGVYFFNGITDFTNRVTHFFTEAKGKPTFMCFDVAFLLLKDIGLRAEFVDQDFESKNIINVTPERLQGPISKSTLLTATNILCPPEGYRALVGKARSDEERKLGITLHAARRLPPKITDSEADLRTAFADFVVRVKQDGFAFPDNFKVGLVFYVDVRRRFMKTDHAFLCIPKADHLIIVEKDNSPGPFVRGDFRSENDLAEYVSLSQRRDTNDPKDVDYGSSVLVTLNERLIKIFHPHAQPR
jgi:hypothetical protein